MITKRGEPSDDRGGMHRVGGQTVLWGGLALVVAVVTVIAVDVAFSPIPKGFGVVACVVVLSLRRHAGRAGNPRLVRSSVE